MWVNNAGVLVTKAWEHEPDKIRLPVETNVIGVISGCLAVVDAIGPEGGHILNVASLSGLGPVPGLSVYAATKHAVVAFTTSLQADLKGAGRPIRVHTRCPDAVATDMVTHRSDDPDAAVLFSGTQLSPEHVADEAMKDARLHQDRPAAAPLARADRARRRRLARTGLRTMDVVRKAGKRRQRA